MTNLKQCSIRPFGQRSITNTFPFRASNQSIDCNTGLQNKQPTKKGSTLSLSEFLNRKLHKSPVLPNSVSGKEVPFSSPLTSEGLNKVAVGEVLGTNGEAKTTLSLDGVFHIFKNVKKNEKDVAGSSSSDSVVSCGMNSLQHVRKRKNLFEGVDHMPSTVKRLAVPGEDFKPTKRKTKKHTPFFNHYKSGGGWWDENMEGLDHEEVGCKDAWEGVGYTTLGAL